LAPLTALVQQIGEPSRSDLPGKAPPVLAPAASALLAAVPRTRVTVCVFFLLVLRADHEADSLVRLVVRTAVEAEEGSAKDGEVHRQLVALLAAGIIGGRPMRRPHMTVGKDRCVEFRGLAG